jgi:hypothetical protein
MYFTADWPPIDRAFAGVSKRVVIIAPVAFFVDAVIVVAKFRAGVVSVHPAAFGVEFVVEAEVYIRMKFFVVAYGVYRFAVAVAERFGVEGRAVAFFVYSVSVAKFVVGVKKVLPAARQYSVSEASVC